MLRLVGDWLSISESETRLKSRVADLGETTLVDGADEDEGERPNVFSNSNESGESKSKASTPVDVGDVS